MLGQILAAIAALGKIFGVIAGWFKKSQEEKIEEGQKKIDEEMDEFKKTGRPPK